MKFGVREICDVVLRAKGKQTIGKKTFYKDEPVCYFDTLKTSTLESAVTTVYAQGGRGNSRLIAWDGEKTVTFTMEDALISPISFSILAGAEIIDATDGKPIKMHVTDTVAMSNCGTTKDESTSVITKVDYIPLDRKPAENETIYVFAMKDGEIISEPYICKYAEKDIGTIDEPNKIHTAVINPNEPYETSELPIGCEAFLVDFYYEEMKASQINIAADCLAGNYYLEASTLFRNQNGEDLPAEFIIPNCKVQSNFTFSMASSGDPSTFTFTMDAFPDYTKWDPEKKVLCAIQIVTDTSADEDDARESTQYFA